MLRICGIYNDKDINDLVFIYLYSKNNTYYGINVLNLKNNDFSIKSIENILHSISDFTVSKKVHYWSVKNIKYLNLIVNGYLGEINKKLYNSILNDLYKSNAWKECNN